MRIAARLLKRGLVDIYWTFRGPSIRVPAIPNNPRSFLFVCKGNICRSPFAEHLALKVRDERRLAGVAFGSAGLHVEKPIPSPENAIQAAKRFGLHLENHRSQSISLELVESYDMIIAMEVWQYAELKSSFRRHREKLFLLPLLCSSKFCNEGYTAFNIQDPYGGLPIAFENCFERISTCIKNVFSLIRQ
jgi:protein-tyrosine phosphatase